MTDELEGLRGLGPVSARHLRAAGIASYDDLERLGAVGAYRLVRDGWSQSSLNMLWALECALLDIPHWLLPAGRKAELRAELAAADSAAP